MLTVTLTRGGRPFCIGGAWGGGGSGEETVGDFLETS